jgi:hypothetical protein
MAWITKQPRLTQIYVYVACQLNDIGIEPDGARIKPWVRQELEDAKIVADPTEIAMVLSGFLHEKAINQADIDKLMQNAKTV